MRVDVRPHCGRSITFFFFNDTATTEIYTLSLHDALPISSRRFERATILGLSVVLPPRDSQLVHVPTPRPSFERRPVVPLNQSEPMSADITRLRFSTWERSEEHTSELQSPDHIVCRLLLEK